MIKINRLNENNNYSGVPIYAASGIHEKIFEVFMLKKYPKNISIAVLGSGSGAFEKRLLDSGFFNIVSVEINANNILTKNTTLIIKDLNEDFSNLGAFDVIIAIEIIEHLENHFHFIRCVKKILKPEGVFYLSSPSIENTFARIKFCLKGSVHWFEEKEIKNTGHITPLFLHIFKLNLEKNNLFISKYFTNKNIWSRIFAYPGIFKKITYTLFFILSFFLKNTNNFEVHLFEIRHKK